MAKGGGAPVNLYDAIGRERRYVLSEVLQVKGLMPLLMKPRNDQPWTPQDVADLIVFVKGSE